MFTVRFLVERGVVPLVRGIRLYHREKNISEAGHGWIQKEQSASEYLNCQQSRKQYSVTMPSRSTYVHPAVAVALSEYLQYILRGVSAFD